jgi:hypothetical protein
MVRCPLSDRGPVPSASPVLRSRRGPSNLFAAEERPNQMNDLELLSSYWTRRYAQEVGVAEDVPPIIGIVGGESDIILSNENEEGDMMVLTAKLLGMVVYPCDAIHIVVCMPCMSLFMDNLGDRPDPADLEGPEARPAFVVWAHTIPTGETLRTVCVSHVSDDGETEWQEIEDGAAANQGALEALNFAAHDFDQFPIGEDEASNRLDAMAQIAQHNGEGYVAQFLDRGTLLDFVRKHGEDLE